MNNYRERIGSRPRSRNAFCQRTSNRSAASSNGSALSSSASSRARCSSSSGANRQEVAPPAPRVTNHRLPRRAPIAEPACSMSLACSLMPTLYHRPRGQVDARARACTLGSMVMLRLAPIAALVLLSFACGDEPRERPAGDGGVPADLGVVDCASFEVSVGTQAPCELAYDDCVRTSSAARPACWADYGPCVEQRREMQAQCYEAQGDDESAEIARCCGDCTADLATCISTGGTGCGIENPRCRDACLGGPNDQEACRVEGR